ncbi:MAG: hypothetical protein AAFQ37_04780, partial [Bacteroidota bacterium]
MKEFVWLISLSFCLFSSCTHSVMGSLPKAEEEQIERFIESKMEEFAVVPGLGVAIVRGSKIVYADGFGFRDVENQLPVTAETGF